MWVFPGEEHEAWATKPSVRHTRASPRRLLVRRPASHPACSLLFQVKLMAPQSKFMLAITATGKGVVAPYTKNTCAVAADLFTTHVARVAACTHPAAAPVSLASTLAAVRPSTLLTPSGQPARPLRPREAVRAADGEVQGP